MKPSPAPWIGWLWPTLIFVLFVLAGPGLSAQCLTPELAVINSCIDHPNPNPNFPGRVESEILVVSSGLVPVRVSEIGIDLPFNGFGAANADIGINVSGNPLGCVWETPNISLLPGCSNVIPLGPDDVIPAGATVIIFITGTTVDQDLIDSEFNFANICQGTSPVYVLQNACERTANAFANGPTPGGQPLRLTTVISECGLRGFNYNTTGLDPNDGSYYLVGLNQFGNLNCQLPEIPETCPRLDTTFFICDPNGDLAPVTAVDLSSIYPLSALSVSFHPTAQSAEVNGDRITEYTPTGVARDTIFSRIIYAENLCIVVSRLIIQYQADLAMTTIPAEPIGGCDPLFTGIGNFNLRLWDAEIGNGQPVTYYLDAAGMDPILDPENFQSPERTIFAQAGVSTCASNIVPIELVLEGEPFVGVMGFQTNCIGNADGGIVLSASGESPFTFEWEGDTLPDVAVLSGIPAGTYNWTVRSRNGCPATGTAVVTDGTPLSLSCQFSSGASGPGVADGSISLTFSDGEAPFSVTYQGAAAGAMVFPTAMGELTGLLPGNYTIVATDVNGCVSEACTAEVTLLDPIFLTCAIRNQANAPAVLGAITVELAGGVPPFNVDLSDGMGGSSTFPDEPAGRLLLPGLPAGNYTITVTDAAGQVTSCMQEIIDEACPLTINGVRTLQDCDGNNFIRLSISGNDGAVNTLWTGPNNIAQFNGLSDAGPLPEGDYSVTISDAGGCAQTSELIEVRNTGMVMIQASIVSNSNPCSPSGFIDIAVTGGGTPPYTLLLVDPTDNSELSAIAGNMVGDVVRFDNLLGSNPGRAYSVYARDASGCRSVSETYLIMSDPVPVMVLDPAEQTITSPNCFGDATGNLLISASGGTAPYTYNWMDYPERATGRILPPGDAQADLPAGLYTIEVTDANGCANTVTIDLPEGDAPTLNCGATQNTMGTAPGSIVINITGGAAPYELTLNQQILESVYPALGVGDTLINGLNAGDYSASVIDANGCVSGSCSFTIGADLCDLSVLATIAPINCAGAGSIELTPVIPNTGMLFDWVDASFPDGSLVSPSIAGTYPVSISDANGCQLDTLFTISEVDDSPDLIAMPAALYTLCTDAMIRLPLTFTGNGPFDLEYRLTAVPAGTPVLNATLTFANNDTLRLSTNDFFAGSNLLEIIRVTDANCSRELGLSTQVDVESVDTIRRFDFVCRTDPIPIGGRVFDLSNPSDTFMVDDGSACGLRYEVDLTFLSPRVPDTSDVFVCPATDYIIPETRDTFNANRPEGEVAYPRLGQCDSIVYVRLEIPPVFLGAYSDAACAGDTIRYGGEIFTVDAPSGIARLSGMASTGCDSLVVVNVNFRRVGELRLLGDHNICQGDSIELRFAYDGPGGINAQVQDFAGNITDLDGLSNGSRVTVYPQASTTYTLINAGIGGCPGEFTGASQVTVNTLSGEAVVVLDPVDSCVDTLGRVRVDVAGGVEPYVYNWSNGPEEASNRNLLGGTYSVTVTDGDGCTMIDSVTISDRMPLRAEVSALPPLCIGGSGQLVIDTLYGGAGFYEMSLDGRFFLPVDRIMDMNPEVGVGDITFQDANDCSVSVSYFVPEAEELRLNLLSDTTIIIGDSIYLNPSMSLSLDTAFWSPPLGLRTPNRLSTVAIPNSSMTYVLNLVTTDGCRYSERVAITVDERLPVYAPTAFSPNGDGFNDLYQLEYGDRVTELTSFQIFNRWGTHLHDGPDGWDGRIDGRLAQIGVYVFTATVKLRDGSERFIKGDFVLMR